MPNPRTDFTVSNIVDSFYLDWEITVILHRNMKIIKHIIPPSASNIFPLSTVLEKLHTIRITSHALTFNNHLLSEDSFSFFPVRML